MPNDLSPQKATPAQKPVIPARERNLSVAGRLFYRAGFRAIGVDRVIAEADVAKATFYRHFPTKDDLIVAWINQAEAMSIKVMTTAPSSTPLTDYAGGMVDIATHYYCLGCTYQGTAAEFGEADHPAHQAALAVKQRIVATLRDQAQKQGLADPTATAEQVFIFLEGVWATKRMFGDAAPLGRAKDALRRLIAP